MRSSEGSDSFEAGPPRSRASNRVPRGGDIDWGLFLACLIAARGFERLLPGISGRQYMLISLTLLSVLVLSQLKQSFSILSSRPIFVIVIIWMVASCLVATRPADSLAATATSVLLMLYAMGRVRPISHTLQTLTLACAASMAPSVVGLAIPVWGIYGFWGAGSSRGYAGFFPWNSAVGYCAAAALICITILYFNEGRRWWHVPTVAAAFLLLSAADAAAPLASLLGAGGALAGLAIYRRFSALPIFIAAAGLGVSALTFASVGDYLSLAKVAEFFGRDSDLSGRTDIWQYAVELVSGSPIFGYGSGVIWDREWNWSSANNGYLEAALRWGLPVAFILVSVILRAGYRLTVASSPIISLWIFGVIANLAVSQLVALTISSLALWLAIAFADEDGKRSSGNLG